MAIHRALSIGKWYELSLAEQLGNIGSEVGRAFRWLDKDNILSRAAADRALELFDLTLHDPRWRGRLKEISRAREVFCDAVFGDNEYKSSPASIEKYFLHFAMAARLRNGC